MLTITEKKLDNARIEIQVDVPIEKVESAYVTAFNKLQGVVKLDGFRKGKAPLHMVEARFRKEADQEVAENLLRTVFLEAVEQNQYTPIDYPRYEFDKISRESPFTFKAIFEVPPTVELGKYKGLAVDEQVVTVSDENVKTEIDAMRERFAKTEKRDASATVINGDLVKMKVRRIDDVEPAEVDKVEYKDYQIVVGKSKDESALDKYIIGMKADERKEVDVKYPKEYQIADLAGQKVTYQVLIEEISSVELPPVDDELAKKLGYETAEEFKKKTADYLEKYVTERTKGDAKAGILKQIVEDGKFDIPDSMIIREMDHLFKRTRESIGYYSDNIEEFAAIMGIEKEAFLAQMREEATQTIRTTMSLSEIAKKEEMKVDENRYREVIESIAKRNNKTPEEIEKIVTENQSRENIETELLLDSAMEFIYENAKVRKLKPISFEEFAKTRMRR